MALTPLLARVLSNRPIMPQTYLLWLEAPLSAQPGQYVMVRCGEGFDPLLRRPFAIHDERPGQIALLIRVRGRGSGWLAERKAGDSLDLLGPLGRGFLVEPSAREIILIAGGMGIAPLAFLARRGREAGLAVALLLGAKSQSQLYPRELLAKGVEVVEATEDGSLGKKGMVTDLLEEVSFSSAPIFAAGPLAMYQTLVRHPLLAGRAVQVSLEVRLGCGFGGCLGCSIPTLKGRKLVCRDGPVFALEEILWEGIRI